MSYMSEVHPDSTSYPLSPLLPISLFSTFKSFVLTHAGFDFNYLVAQDMAGPFLSVLEFSA